MKSVAHAALAVLFCAAGALSPAAHGQKGWKPTRPVMVIAPNAPGGTSDRSARELQRIFEKHKLVEVPVNVVNRPGGGGTIALNHLNSYAGDPHVLLLATSATLSNYATGLSAYNYADFTPIAMLLADNYGVNVQAGSAVRSARDLLDWVRKSPDTFAFGVSGVGGSNHVSLMSALTKSGIDVKRVKIASFAGGGQITLALLGGHVDAINTGLSNMVEHLRQGKMRTLVITGPRRMPAPFADVPTWKEVGVDVTMMGWRGVLATKGITPAQLAFWDGVFRRVAQSEDWKADLERNFWVNIYADAASTKRQMDVEYVELKQILTQLGMAKSAEGKK
jgi:putative tricarboxylic transport membrane protein